MMYGILSIIIPTWYPRIHVIMKFNKLVKEKFWNMSTLRNFIKWKELLKSMLLHTIFIFLRSESYVTQSSLDKNSKCWNICTRTCITHPVTMAINMRNLPNEDYQWIIYWKNVQDMSINKLFTLWISQIFRPIIMIIS